MCGRRLRKRFGSATGPCLVNGCTSARNGINNDQAFVGLNAAGEPELFLTIESLDNRSRGPLLPASSYRVPACRHSFRYGGWSVREFEPLPQFHRPARWDPERIRQVADDVSRALHGRLERPPDIPSHWLPMHGRSRALESARGRTRAAVATRLGGCGLGSATTPTLFVSSSPTTRSAGAVLSGSPPG